MAELKEYQNRMIYQLVQQEFLTAELYKGLAWRFPRHEDLWLSLSADELEHATWLEYLFKKTGEGIVEFEEQRIKTYTIETFHAYLQNAIESVKNDRPMLARALSLTLDIERSLLEKRIFEHFTSSDREMVRTLRDLRNKMNEHVQRAERSATSLLQGMNQPA